MIRHVTRSLFVSVLGCFVSQAAFGIEVPLKYEKYPEQLESFRPIGAARLEVTKERPAGDWKLPGLTSKQPLYTLTRLGDEKRLLILDRLSANDPFYNRIYFDSNGNRDLTDEPAIDGRVQQASEDVRAVEFPSVDISIKIDRKPVPYSFRTQAVQFGSAEELNSGDVENRIGLSLVANCGYGGEFELDGQTYRVLLGDGNANGRFNDRLPIQRDPRTGSCSPSSGESDIVCLTSGKKVAVYDTQPCGDLLLVSGKLFEVSISTPEGKLTLTPVTETLAALKLGMETQHMSIFTEDGQHCVMMYRPGSEITIPAGKYRLFGYAVLRKDDQGDLWLLEAEGVPGTPAVTVGEGIDGVIEFGEPYMPIAQVPPWERDNVKKGGATEVHLMLQVQGKGKEELTEVRRIEGNKTRIPLSSEEPGRPKEPTYKIVKSDGEVVAAGSFEYG